MYEEKVVLTDREGTKHEFVLSPVKRKENRRLTAIITPDSFKASEANNLPIKTNSWEDYKEHIVMATVVTPKITKIQIDEMDPTTVFEPLFLKCQEVNGTSQKVIEGDTKKLKSPSKEE